MTRRKRLKIGDTVGYRDTHILTGRPIIEKGWKVTGKGKTFISIEKGPRVLQLRRKDLIKL